MNTFKKLFADEFGSILSAELVLVGTVGLVAVSAGWRSLSRSVDAELFELASAIRNLDQSYSVAQVEIDGNWSAGSEYIQPSAEASVDELEEQHQAYRKLVEERLDQIEN